MNLPLDQIVASIPRDQIPAAITALAARLLAEPAQANGTAPATPVEPDTTLDVPAIAQLLKKSKRWVWRNQRKLPLRRVGRGLIASRRDLDRWLGNQKVK